MGSACGIKSTCPDQPNRTKSKLSKEPSSERGSETEVEGISLKKACMGHYFSKSSYKDNNEIKKEWRKACSNKAPKEQEPVPLFVNRKGILVDEKLTEAEAEINLSEFAENEAETFHKMLAAGPPSRYRWVAWKVALRIKKIKIPGLYEELINKNTPWVEEINKDIDRTFPTHPLFAEVKYSEKGKKALKNILSAYAIYNKYVGYCQGMNFIAAFLLIISGFQEEEAFWGVVSLTRYKFTYDPLSINGIEGLYSDHFPLLRSLERLFDAIAKEAIADVTNHLVSIEFAKGFWLQKWISTLFLYSFSKGYCIRLWDFILTQGISQLFPLIITILQCFRKELLNSDFAECYELLKGFQEGERLPPVDELIATATKIRLNWDNLLILHRKYQEEVELEDFEERKRNGVQEEDNPQDTNRELDMEEIVNERVNGLLPEIRRIGGRRPMAISVRNSLEGIKLPPINQENKSKFVFESSSLIFSDRDQSKRENIVSSSREDINVKNEIQSGIQAEEIQEERIATPLQRSNTKLSHVVSERLEDDDSVLFRSLNNHTVILASESIDRSVREIRARVVTKQFFI